MQETKKTIRKEIQMRGGEVKGGMEGEGVAESLVRSRRRERFVVPKFEVGLARAR